MATVTYEREAVEQLAELPNVVVACMEAIVRRLENWPAVSGAKPLRGDLGGITGFARGTIGFSFGLSVTK